MSKPRKKLTGRPATDAKGNATWKFGDSDAEVETGLIKALGEGLSLESPPEKVVVDPYDQSTPRSKEATKGARSLDDMRRLNEEMKREHAELVSRLRKREVRKKAPPLMGAMRLRFDNRELVVDDRHACITIGRAEGNDVMVTGSRSSRLHARIELSRDKFVLTDQSENGTYVRSADGKDSFVRRGSLQLTGQGMIGIGRRPGKDPAQTIHFSCTQG
jgi:FHA domain